MTGEYPNPSCKNLRGIGMKLSLKLFLEDKDSYVFGPGRAELLRSVAEMGSLHKAAQKLGMSYRWAWGRLRNAEEALGIKLLSQDKTAGKGNVKALTPEARELLAWFNAIQEDLDAVLEKMAAVQPPFLQSMRRASANDRKKSRNVLD
jgi:molybdate transport repressor ModE-like protein